MTVSEQTAKERQDMAIQASADALLSVCSLQTGTDPRACLIRASAAIVAVYVQARDEHIVGDG